MVVLVDCYVYVNWSSNDGSQKYFSCSIIMVFCWQFGNSLRMRRYFIAVDACKHGDIETIKAMKQYGLFLGNHLQTKYSTLLMAAAECGNLEIVIYLLKNGSSIHESALHQAIRFGHLEVTKFLMLYEYRLNNEDFDFERTAEGFYWKIKYFSIKILF